MTASKLRTFVLLTGVLLAGGLAQAQQAPQSSSPAATPASTTATPQGDKTTADSTAAATRTAAVTQPVDPLAAQKAAAAKLVSDARSAGFRPEMIKGTQMFCRTAVELGSNFPVRTCYDSDQVKIKIQEYAEQRNQLEQMHNIGMQTK